MNNGKHLRIYIIGSRKLMRFGVAVVFGMMVFAGSADCTLGQSAIGPGSAAPNGQQDIFQLISRLKSTINESSPEAMDDGSKTPIPNNSSGATSNSNLPGSGNGNLDSIQQKLELLRTMMANQKTGEPPGPLPSVPAAQNSTSAADSESTHLPGVVPFPMPENMDEAHAIEPSTNPDGADANADSNASLPRFQTIVASPVDSLELAGSLFATGNYPMALKTWQEISDRIADPHERQWLDYFMASSYRLTGKREEAEAAYRELVASKQQGYPVTVAAEWLKWMERRKQLNSENDKIFKRLDIIQKGLEKNGK